MVVWVVVAAVCVVGKGKGENIDPSERLKNN